MVSFADAAVEPTGHAVLPALHDRPPGQPYPNAPSPTVRGRRSLPREASTEDLERLGDEIAELAAHIHAATYELLVKLREFDQAGGWSRGFRSCAHWLSWRTRIGANAAREKMRVARALDDLPLISEAMRRGEFSYSVVRALTRIATGSNEHRLLEVSRHTTAAQVETIVRAWRRVDRLEERESESRRHESRRLTLCPDDDGSYVLRGRLDPEVGALVERALDAAQRMLYERDRSHPVGRGDAPVQRRADAIGLVAELALATMAGEARAPSATANRAGIRRAGRFQVVVHVDADALCDASGSLPRAHGSAVIAGGVGVTAETSRRIACDANRVVMKHDAEGRVLDVGRRSRIVPSAIRRALDYRDGGCRFPACGNRFCDAHHIVHWADGGETRLDNLVYLCRFHHRAVHEGRLGVRLDEDARTVAFTRPDGTPIPDVPPPRIADVEDEGASGTLRRAHAERGIVIGGWTPTPDWRGERLDLDFAILTLRQGDIHLP